MSTPEVPKQNSPATDQGRETLLNLSKGRVDAPATDHSNSAESSATPQNKITLALYVVIAVSLIDWILSFFELNFLPSIIVLGEKDYTNYALVLASFAFLKTLGAKKATSEVAELLSTVLSLGEYSVYQQRVTLKTSMFNGELGVLVATNERLLFFKIADVNGDNTDFLEKPELHRDWRRSEIQRVESGTLNLVFCDASNSEFKFQVGLGQAAKWLGILNSTPNSASTTTAGSAPSALPSNPPPASSGAPTQGILDKAKSIAENTLKAGQAWADKSLKAAGGVDGIKNKAKSVKMDIASGKFKRDVMAGNPESIKILAGAIGIVLLLGFMILGSSDRNVGIVRSGVLKSFSKSKTIGDAFEKSGVVSGGKWTSFKADTGERIVEFSGSIKDIDKTIATTMKEGQKELGLLFAIAAPYIKMFDIIKIDSCVYRVQFAIGAHDSKSFELRSSELIVKASPKGEVKEGLKKLLNDKLTITDSEAKMVKALYDADAADAAMVVKSLVLQPVMAAGILMN